MGSSWQYVCINLSASNWNEHSVLGVLDQAISRPIICLTQIIPILLYNQQLHVTAFQTETSSGCTILTNKSDVQKYYQNYSRSSSHICHNRYV